MVKYGLERCCVSNIESNPEMSKNDAFRRDCTINALFCDLHTELAENFTGPSIQDIAARAIRILLPPKEIFAHDLLRVILLIRFASHLDFTIVPEGKGPMKLPEIKEYDPSLVLA